MKPASDARLIASDNVNTEVTAPASVAIASYEKDRLASQVTAQVKRQAPAGTRPARNYRLAIEVTRYEKGNAFARAMLAGLGQMHLDGTVSLYALPAQTKVGEFSISKTFSWGGIYGAATTMETVEEEFAKAVAAAAAAEAPR
jgi:hypothetical protein